MRLLKTTFGDWIQLGILLVAGIGLLGGFWSYCEGRFATVGSVTFLAENLRSEIEERRELKMEIDALYLKQIPQQERVNLKFHQKGER